MAKQLMIYERAVPISVEAHKKWSVKTDGTYGFAKDVNSVPILAAEFAPSAMEYTIIFAGEGDVVFPSVILGMKEGENACVNEDGTWDGRYVPAYFRRYPFVFATGIGDYVIPIEAQDHIIPMPCIDPVGMGGACYLL